MKNTLFDAELSVHKFGSHLLHVPSLKNWADSKGFHFPITNPPIEDYEFVQVEALLVAIMRVVHSSMTPEDAFREVQNNPELNGHELAQHSSITARWLIGADVHLQWRKEISAAINKQELKLLKRGSLLPVTSEDLEVLLSSMPHIDSNTATLQAKVSEQSLDEEFASWFDDVSYQQLAGMFKAYPTYEQNEKAWKSYAAQANKNGLKEAARASRAKFNPFNAGMWWLDRKRPTGWSLERLHRALANNLPPRSKEHEQRLTGEDFK
jgi:hypothetical protein